MPEGEATKDDVAEHQPSADSQITTTAPHPAAVPPSTATDPVGAPVPNVANVVPFPSWNEIFQKMTVGGRALGPPLDIDGVLIRRMKALEAITGRPLIIYAVDMANPQKTGGNPLLGLINFNDKDGFMEALRGIDEKEVDVLLQSPGGLAEATESIVA